MKIALTGIQDERLKRPIQLIGNLYFEECSVSFEQIEVCDWHLHILLEEKESLIVEGTLRQLDSSTTFDVCVERPHLQGLQGKEAFKRVKNTVLAAVLALFTKATGMEQKWGILTGIRPTKLYHKKYEEGHTEEAIFQELHESYLIHEEKIELMKEIVKRQLTVIPDLYDLKREVSIYIGIPFCPTKCAYCTFPAYAINGRQGTVSQFLKGLHHEMQQIGAFLKEQDIKITTIYYGGGTPTSISAIEMDALYEEMYRSFPHVENVREVTVEAGRPDTITEEKINILKKWNIDRISINPQSYHQETLKAIGRHHTVDETIEKFQLAREMGMNNINMDLIIGLPGEGKEIFDQTLAETKKLMPESLTVHTLSFKRASEMTKNKRRYQVAGREEVEEMMNAATTWTKEHGYVPYYLYRQKNILGNLENVGYALPTQESMYNIMIMEEKQTIIGLGCGASSKFIHPKTGVITRYANPKEPKAFNESYEAYTKEKVEILTQLFS